MSRLSHADPSATLSEKDADHRLEVTGQPLVHLRLLLAGQLGEQALGPPLCVLFEGWDASGKGGAIKRLVAPLDLRHVRGAQFAASTHDEKRRCATPGWWSTRSECIA